MSKIKSIFLVTMVCQFIWSCQNKEPKIDLDKTEENLYKEAHRNQFHFSPQANWMNDPNGMVYYEDEYHLFYQYYPDSTIWGPMHWGHAISRDLINWEHLPIALYPDDLGYGCAKDFTNTDFFCTLFHSERGQAE